MTTGTEPTPSVDPAMGMRCMAIWLRSNGFTIQADDCDAYAQAADGIAKLASQAVVCWDDESGYQTDEQLDETVAGLKKALEPWRRNQK